MRWGWALVLAACGGGGPQDGAVDAGAVDARGIDAPPVDAGLDGARDGSLFPDATVADAPNDGRIDAGSADAPRQAALRVEPPYFHSGSTCVYTVSPASTITVMNVGDLATGMLAVTTTNDRFVVSADGCTGTTLAGGASCSFDVAFAAHSSAEMGALSVSATPGGTTSVELRGSVVSCDYGTLSPSPFSFGYQPTGTTTPPVSFTLTNIGGGSVTVTSAAISGADADHFPIDSDGCTGLALAAGASCVVTVRFAAISDGARSAVLTLTTSVGSFASALSGFAVTADLTLSPTLHDYGTQAVGSASSDQRYSVMWSATPGSPSTGTPSISLGGTDASDFVISGHSCTAPLAPAESCTIDVRFEPLSAGEKNATLTISMSPGGSGTATLLGEGTL